MRLVCCSVAVDHFDITNMCLQITQDILTVVNQWVSKVQGNYDRCWQQRELSFINKRTDKLKCKKQNFNFINTLNKSVVIFSWSPAESSPCLYFGLLLSLLLQEFGELICPSHHFFQSFLSQVLQNICPCKSATLHPRAEFIPRN